MDIKVEKIEGSKTEEIPYPEIPDKVRKLIGRCNWIEEGICPDLSTVRGYRWDGKEKLEQMTGSSWNFVPLRIWRVTPEIAEEIEKMKQREREKQEIKEQDWSEFLADCDVSHWAWTRGEEGDILEADPKDEPDFSIVSVTPPIVNWGGENVCIRDEIGTAFVILAPGRREGEWAPLDGCLFATKEEVEKYAEVHRPRIKH